MEGTNFQDMLRDKICPQDFGIPEKYAEYAEDYAKYIAVKIREEYIKICEDLLHEMLK